MEPASGSNTEHRWRPTQEAWLQFAASKHGKVLLKAFRTVLLVAVIGYLIYELRDVAWEDIFSGLPMSATFYLLLLLVYFLLPVSQMLAYRVTWTFDAWQSLPAFIKKRIFNKDVLGYSGEVYFYGWARKHVAASDRAIMQTIRDQNIVSSAASTSIALGLLAFFLYSGQLNITEVVGESTATVLVAGGIVFLILAIVALRLRKCLFSMPARSAGKIFAIHVQRLVVGQVLQIAMWAIAMPEVSLEVWFTYAALSIIVTRIPFVPNADLIFMGIAVSMSGVLGVSEAGLFALLAAIAVVNRVANLVSFSGLSLLTGGLRMERVVQPVE